GKVYRPKVRFNACALWYRYNDSEAARRLLRNTMKNQPTNQLAIPSLDRPAIFSDQYSTVMGIRLRYWQMGESGSPLLLLHGVNGCVENWRWNICVFATSHRVVALDGPGHGLSQPDERAYNLDFVRDLVAEFMHSLGLERASLVALS